MKGYKFINLLFVNVREIETPSDTTVRALCHMRLFGFHVTPVCFSLRVVDFYTVKGCFLSPLPDCRRTSPASARDMPQQAYIPRVFLQP